MKKLIILTMFLVGCANTNGDWSCKDGQSFSCMTAKETDKKIKENRVSLDKFDDNLKLPKMVKDNPPKRTNELVRTINILPYSDEYGNLITNSKIHVVINKTEWNFE